MHGLDDVVLCMASTGNHTNCINTLGIVRNTIVCSYELKMKQTWYIPHTSAKFEQEVQDRIHINQVDYCAYVFFGVKPYCRLTRMTFFTAS